MSDISWAKASHILWPQYYNPLTVIQPANAEAVTMLDALSDPQRIHGWQVRTDFI